MSTTELDTVTGEIVRYSGPSLPVPLSPDEAKQKAQWVRDVTRAALTEGADFGVIPGTGGKPTLLKPGAEMLLLAAGLGFSIAKVDDEDARGHQGVTYRCTVRRADLVVAECDGYAGYDETRFAKGSWRADWNSVIKMAQKRALVGAALNAVAGSGLFTQDMEDHADAPPVFNAHVLMEPFLKQLDADAKRELSEWRKAEDLPSSTEMSPEQAALALVKIGQLLGAPDVPVRDHALDGEPQGESVGEHVETPPEPTPRRAPAKSPGEKLHRDLGRLGFKDKTEHEELIFNASGGRTVHAAELDTAEIARTYRMAEDVTEGRETWERIVNANDEYRRDHAESVAS